MDKDSARKRGLSARRSVSQEVRGAYDASLFRKMTGYAETAKMTGCYVSMGEEADTRRFLAWCFRHDKPVAVPLIQGNTLTFHRISSFDDLHPGTFGVEEPAARNEVPLSEIDLMFVPLSAFDGQKNRTGYGKGYYDAVLQPSMKKVGIAYPEQQVDRIETDPWDIPLDEILLPN